jgi:hypothetical protein
MELGEQGDVDGSMASAQQAEVLKRQHENLLRQSTAPERTMSVCDICGIFISSTDNDARRQVRGGGRGFEPRSRQRGAFFVPGSRGAWRGAAPPGLHGGPRQVGALRA